MAKSIKKRIFLTVITAAIGSAVSYYVGKALKGEAIKSRARKKNNANVKIKKITSKNHLETITKDLRKHLKI